MIVVSTKRTQNVHALEQCMMIVVDWKKNDCHESNIFYNLKPIWTYMAYMNEDIARNGDRLLRRREMMTYVKYVESASDCGQHWINRVGTSRV